VIVRYSGSQAAQGGTVTSSGNLTLGGALSGVALASQVSGTLPIANGGTGATSLTANNVLLGNGTSALQVVAPSTNGNFLRSNGTTWQSVAVAIGSGTVTSVATGNGLSGGTITSSGTLVLACPSSNSIGSYAWVTTGNTDFTVSFGGNYSGGGQLELNAIDGFGTTNTQISGTWKWMGQNRVVNGDVRSTAIACRVS
jgi:hypothetical protein